MITIYLHGFSGTEKGLARFARAMNIHPYHLWILPGFGGKPVTKTALRSLPQYCDEVMQEIKKTYPSETFHIVGHSHGAIVAFCLAAKFPHDVVRLTIINPVAKPRVVSRIASLVVDGATYVMPSWMLLRSMRSKRMVDAVSNYMSKEHALEDRKKIYEMRQYETKYYTKEMFRLSRHATSFASVSKNYTVVAPTTIVYDPKDNIASSRDASWYALRCSDNVLLEVDGGHLGVVAAPERIAKALGDNTSERI